MKESSTRANRLAAYGAIAAGTMAAGGHADIQMYDGPPIPLDSGGGPTMLSLGGVSFSFNATNNTFVNVISSSFSDCCGFTTTGKFGSTFCTFYAPVGFISQLSTNNLSFVGCGSNLASIQFASLGDSVGSGGCYGGTFICASTFFSSFGCAGGSAFSNMSCGDSMVRYAQFTILDGGVYEGWARIEGTPGNYEITQWAYQDDGSDITVGEEPAPKCNADINGDGKVDSADLGLLISAWGDCE